MKTVEIKLIRQAIADYIASEGCYCCEGQDHEAHQKTLAKLLGVPMYKDRSGYNFSKFRSNKK